ncbi:uncharacterized protein K452DRAFT_352873 [Aplosporella prunicola CBS 121167]|uniref:Microbial-type PARG catalytic domain-containing protein n=1 Tax=Aplosporella prunicola CBS 121167 TaxID=1176127 RepID=A0A6A6B3E9_9PEZI|nr:uncharacterized protein K452DRAFT_352873 [Aplosporella prunicola CBS 121167]KAF2138729.1 hypothetical protein K452DRAFT_352873 [Aplosporella prunicola CBS 121167]
MGRLEPTVVVPPQAFRRDARSKQARATINKTIPAILTSFARARKGIDAAELIVDPQPVASDTEVKSDNAIPKEPMQITLQVAETLDTARQLYQNSPSSPTKRPRIAILNMASPLCPGGGFLNGAASQEERLCMRSTLYPSLRDSFYRLPEIGGVFTPDVLVFRDHTDEARELSKKESFFVDVVTAGMLRFPDLDGEESEEKTYAHSKDRELVLSKMRSVMRILKMKGADKVVLGAWGCGAYGNPVMEIAKAWRKVLLGTGSAKRKGKSKRGGAFDGGEGWDGLQVVFAIKDRRMAEDFAKSFESGLVIDEVVCEQEEEMNDGSTGVVEEMRIKITEMKLQMEQARNPDLKARLQTVLAGLKSQLAELSGGSQSSGDSYPSPDEIQVDEGDNEVSEGEIEHKSSSEGCCMSGDEHGR